ncbi:MAG: RNA 3'-phosphate cyclase [Chloroflexi bacterium]|nr:RNA 3'-phosphate cyclase [Chloroflexota bacterium]
MIQIDGATKSGSGTILRYAVSLCSLLGEELHLTNIRAKREKPGLQPQHLKSVEACAQMAGGQTQGAIRGSQELIYKPGPTISGGHYQWDIGTAGSTTMLAMTVLPLACFSGQQTTFTISGGLFQDSAPSAHHMEHVLLPILSKMGIKAELRIVRPGYVPRGGGIIELKVQPAGGRLTLLRLLELGQVRRIQGIALSSNLKERQVSQRMAETCQRWLKGKGYSAQIEAEEDDTAVQAGASLALWAETDAGYILGADRAGRPGRSSEEIGRYVAQSLLEDIATGATVDRHLADQLIIYAALAQGTSEYIIPRVTDHVDTNLWLVEQFGAKWELEGNRVRIQGIGYGGK